MDKYYFFLDDCSMAADGGPCIEWNVVIFPADHEYHYFINEGQTCESSHGNFTESSYKYLKNGPLTDEFIGEILSIDGPIPSLKLETYDEEEHGWVVYSVQEKTTINIKSAKR